MASGPSAAEAQSIGSHIAHCPQCARMIEEVLALPDVVAFVDAALPPGHEDADHLDDDEIAAFVAGVVGAEERRRALHHIAACVECRSDVDALRRWSARRKLRSVLATPALLAIAASVVIVLAVTFVVTRTPRPEPSRPTVATPPIVVRPSAAPVAPREPAIVAQTMRPEWRALVDGVRTTGELPFPRDLRDLAVRDTFRGGISEGGVDRVWPNVTAVTDVNPRFIWPAVDGGEYIVTLSSDRGVTRSGVLREPGWRPPVPLIRGTTYSWQVDVKQGEEQFSLPAPPAPPAAFRVVTSREADEIDAAARQFADDHLLLGLLYAKAGVVDEARRHLDAWRRATGDPVADRLLAQLPKP